MSSVAVSPGSEELIVRNSDELDELIVSNSDEFDDNDVSDDDEREVIRMGRRTVSQARCVTESRVAGTIQSSLPTAHLTQSINNNQIFQIRLIIGMIAPPVVEDDTRHLESFLITLLTLLIVCKMLSLNFRPEIIRVT